jgi:hypothetical protein
MDGREWGAVRDPADNDTDDWFEIHNPTASAVDLSGWKLTDDPVSPTPFIVPNGWSIAPVVSSLYGRIMKPDRIAPRPRRAAHCTSVFG